MALSRWIKDILKGTFRIEATLKVPSRAKAMEHTDETEKNPMEVQMWATRKRCFKCMLITEDGHQLCECTVTKREYGVERRDRRNF